MGIKDNRGSTLVIIIITIVGLLIISYLILNIVAGINAYKEVRSTAVDARRKVDIDVIAKALETYYGMEIKGQYPAVKPEWFSTKSIPTDPKGGSYLGIPTTSVPNFKVCAVLEGVSPSQYCVSSKHK